MLANVMANCLPGGPWFRCRCEDKGAPHSRLKVVTTLAGWVRHARGADAQVDVGVGADAEGDPALPPTNSWKPMRAIVSVNVDVRSRPASRLRLERFVIWLVALMGSVSLPRSRSVTCKKPRVPTIQRLGEYASGLAGAWLKPTSNGALSWVVNGSICAHRLGLALGPICTAAPTPSSG